MKFAKRGGAACEPASSQIYDLRILERAGAGVSQSEMVITCSGRRTDGREEVLSLAVLWKGIKDIY